MSILWKSTLNSGLDPKVWNLNRNISHDFRLWKEDIQGSKAHVLMLQKSGLITLENSDQILATLDLIQTEIANGKCVPKETDEDVHSFIERELVERMGIQGSNFHIARSRNEQILLDVTLYLRRISQEIIEGLENCEKAFEELKVKSADHIIPSYTHLRRAQPVFLRQVWDSHQVFASNTKKEFRNFLNDLNHECPMGAGAINGTSLPTQPEIEADLLGFHHPPKNSISTISSRRPFLNFASISVHWLIDVSRFMEDLIFYSTEEAGFISFQSAVTTGSSMMPQKRNPDLCEILRSKSAVALGNYISLMTLLKGLPMGYMKDLQEDKPQLFSIVDILLDTVNIIPVLLQSIILNPDKMAKASSDPLLLATDVMEWLVQKGTPLREAHHQVANWIQQSGEYPGGFLEYVKSIEPTLPQLDVKMSCYAREKK